MDRPAGRASFCTGNFNKDVTDEAASFFVPQKELKKMNICKNTPDKEANDQRKVYSVAEPQNTEMFRGCPYAGVGFICWSRTEAA